MWTVSAQNEFVEPDEYICLADEDGGWTCALGKEPQAEPLTPQPPQEPQRWVQPEPHERSFPGGSDVRPLPLPVPSEPVQLAEPEVASGSDDQYATQEDTSASATAATSSEVIPERDTTTEPVAELVAEPPVQAVVNTNAPSPPSDNQTSPYWTIQIAALLDPDGVNTIASEVGISGDELEVRTEQRLGETWTVILLGQFASASEATLAARQRGLEQRGWVRRVQAQTTASPMAASSRSSERTTQRPEPEPEPASGAASRATSLAAAVIQPLSGLPPTHYTVQLASVDSDAGFAELIEQSGLSDQPHWTHITRRNGQPWHLLLWGQFATLSEASVAIQSLPTNVRAAGPWPRRIGDVLNEPG